MQFRIHLWAVLAALAVGASTLGFLPWGPVAGGMVTARADEEQPELSFTVSGQSEEQYLADEQVLKALGNETAYDFFDTSLAEVADYLSDLHNIPIEIDEKALDDMGLSGDDPVTQQAEGVTFCSALFLLLDPLDLSFMVQDGVLRITTVEAAENALVSRNYHSPVFAQYPAREGEALVDLIQSTIQPTEWDVFGGPGGVEFDPAQGELRVENSLSVQLQVESLLRLLIAAQTQPSAEVTSAPVVWNENERERQEHIAAALSGQTEFTLRDVPLDDAVIYIQQLHHVPVVLDLYALYDVGIGSDSLLSASPQNVSLAEALDTMLEPLGLTWAVQHDVIFVTTTQELENSPETRVYSGGGLRRLTARRTDQLIEHIVDRIEPDSWSEVGGSGEIMFFAPARALVVTQMPAVHAQIEQELTR